ncbi:hypothetical protein BKK47_07605 [Rodentibacter mrazii]|uniref:Uncharacterized protein n=1 Tax=Rodentibacter mrazii TaxID=1908257 RepID=A0A1V3IFM4_9PAST|nr:hypothetical protein [Rodentibacter mrazii]OOF39074.1 hypothetical protein BKK47_07605 [Rodentibacter mrazii]
MVSVNQATEMCLQAYRSRSSFKPDVMTYLLDKAKRFIGNKNRRNKANLNPIKNHGGNRG